MPGPAGRENRSHAVAGFGALPNDPIAILAHDGDAIEDNRLAGRQERNRFVPVEFPRQLEVDVGHEGILQRGASGCATASCTSILLRAIPSRVEG